MYYIIDENNKIIDFVNQKEKANIDFEQSTEAHMRMVEHMNNNNTYAYIQNGQVVYDGCSAEFDPPHLAEIREIEDWFQNYDTQVIKSIRANSLNEPFDKNIYAMHIEAKMKAGRLNELKNISGQNDNADISGNATTSWI